MVPLDLITPGMERCAFACVECHRVCLRTAMCDSLIVGGARLVPEHFRVLMDCADLCATTADFLLRGSAFHEGLCGVCAAVCTACAQSCSQFEGEAVSECRAACQRCAESCREVVGVTR